MGSLGQRQMRDHSGPRGAEDQTNRGFCGFQVGGGWQVRDLSRSVGQWLED